ncbi:hypothetical protein [Puia sp.]|jgi:hypothetical protein|uniref:hypothetical protein n=1 Tax=Puia sp. TaxID=2045100 RepID=UPI002F3EC2E1
MKIRNLFWLGWLVLGANPAIGQQQSIVPDTAVNNIKLADRASTEKVLGTHAWDKHFEAGGMLPRIEIVNRDKTQVLRLLFDYGGSKNSVDGFQLLTVDKTYKLPAKTMTLDVTGFVTSAKITLGMPRAGVLKAFGNKLRVVSNKGGIEEMLLEMDESTAFVKRHNEYKYFARCSFKNSVLVKYTVGFESP